MKIVHIIFALQSGGSENMLVDIINEQVKTEQVSLIIINDQVNNELLHQINRKVEIILLHRKEKSKNLLPFLNLNFYILTSNPDVIHCHQASIVNTLLFYRKKAVLTIHTTGVKTSNLEKYKKVFAISKTVQNDIKKRSNIIPAIIYNGINLNLIKKKEEYSLSSFRMVQVGRLDHEIKGQHILLGALNILVYEKKITNISLDFIGEGKSLEYLQNLVNEYNLNNYVNFLGLKDREYIYQHLKDYNLLVQPSLYEGFGLTIVEAMVAKVPVLVSDIDGPLEVIGQGEFGWVFTSNNKNSLANVLLNIRSNYLNDIFIQKVKNAYTFCEKNFSINKTSYKYCKEYTV